ncbi:hypothetical protein Aduo_019972 [Ancylostoma duodenale]
MENMAHVNGGERELTWFEVQLCHEFGPSNSTFTKKHSAINVSLSKEQKSSSMLIRKISFEDTCPEAVITCCQRRSQTQAEDGICTRLAKSLIFHKWFSQMSSAQIVCFLSTGAEVRYDEQLLYGCKDTDRTAFNDDSGLRIL